MHAEKSGGEKENESKNQPAGIHRSGTSVCCTFGGSVSAVFAEWQRVTVGEQQQDQMQLQTGECTQTNAQGCTEQSQTRTQARQQLQAGNCTNCNASCTCAEEQLQNQTRLRAQNGQQFRNADGNCTGNCNATQLQTQTQLQERTGEQAEYGNVDAQQNTYCYGYGYQQQCRHGNQTP
jgi:hypothetical protein